MVLTPIHSPSQLYLICIILLAGMSGSSIASHFHERWLARWGISFYRAYIVILMLVFLMSLVVIDYTPFAVGYLEIIAGVIAGLCLGWIIFKIDLSLSRKYSRHVFKNNNIRQAPNPETRFAQAVSTDKKTAETAIEKQQVPFMLELILIGAMEELVFRLLIFALMIAMASQILAGVLFVVSFVLFLGAHLNYGWHQVFIKIPLALLTFISLVLTYNILIAIVAHCLLNGLIFRMAKASTVGEMKSQHARFSKQRKNFP